MNQMTATLKTSVADLEERYAASGTSLAVDFRALVELLPRTDRATHFMHPYPAKLLPQIPALFLNDDGLSKPGDVIVDPFCGSGTVLVEGILAGRCAVGVDSNPLARLIARVKTTPLDSGRLRESLVRLCKRIPASAAIEMPSVVNIDLWFSPRVRSDLLRIREAILHTRDSAVREFFEVCFSVCVRHVSLADPRLTVPVRLRADKYPRGHWLRKKAEARVRWLKSVDVVGEFERVVHANTKRMAALVASSPACSARVAGVDARRLCDRDERVLAPGSAKLVITSPPYLGAQKYIRASSLSMGWLGLDGGRSLRAIEDENIGREHFPKAAYDSVREAPVKAAAPCLERVRQRNPLRAHIAATYLDEMSAAVSEIDRVLDPNGTLVMVTGANMLSGEPFATPDYLKDIAGQNAWRPVLELDDAIRGRTLLTRRNGTESVISREHVVMYRKDR
jgi:hypothetical protein